MATIEARDIGPGMAVKSTDGRCDRCRTRCHAVREADGRLWLYMAHPVSGAVTGERHLCVSARESRAGRHGHIHATVGGVTMTFHPVARPGGPQQVPTGYAGDEAYCLDCPPSAGRVGRGRGRRVSVVPSDGGGGRDDDD